MSIARVDSVWSGPSIRGGGITQSFFDDDGGGAQDLVDAIETWWTALLGAIVADNFVSVEPTVVILDEITGNLEGQVTTTVSGPLEGTGGSAPLPPAVQGLIRWFTPVVANNRLIRGHWFLPAMSEGNNESPGIPSSGVVAAVNAAAATLIGDADAHLVIWHRPKAPNDGSIGAVQSASMWGEWATLRSRRD